MPITKDHLRIVEVILREIVKLVLVGVAVYAFLTLLDAFIKEKDTTKQIIYGGADTLFGVIIVRVYIHYFPLKK